jgi:hypothetical protein
VAPQSKEYTEAGLARLKAMSEEPCEEAGIGGWGGCAFGRGGVGFVRVFR